MDYFHEETPAPPDESVFDLDIPEEDAADGEEGKQRLPSQPVMTALKPLTPAQERRLRDYFEEEFLQLQRNLTKRSLYPELELVNPSLDNPLKEPKEFLQTITRLAHMILFANASMMQTEHFLRLTGEFLTGLKEYHHPPLTEVLDVLDEFDKGWVALLDGKQMTKDGVAVEGSMLSSVSQTQRIRLRALVGEWQEYIFDLSRPRMTPMPTEGTDSDEGEEDNNEDDAEFEPVGPTEMHATKTVVFPRTLQRLLPS